MFYLAKTLFGLFILRLDRSYHVNMIANMIYNNNILIAISWDALTTYIKRNYSYLIAIRYPCYSFPRCILSILFHCPWWAIYSFVFWPCHPTRQEELDNVSYNSNQIFLCNPAHWVPETDISLSPHNSKTARSCSTHVFISSHSDRCNAQHYIDIRFEVFWTLPH